MARQTTKNRSEYLKELQLMDERDALYNGTRQVAGINGKVAKRVIMSVMQ